MVIPPVLEGCSASLVRRIFTSTKLLTLSVWVMEVWGQNLMFLLLVRGMLGPWFWISLKILKVLFL